MKSIHIVEQEFNIDIDEDYNYFKFLSKLEFLQIKNIETKREMQRNKRKRR